jgi:hypothetical protein
MTNNEILNKVKEGLLGKRSISILNLEILINNPTAIPEHINYYEEIDRLIGEVAEIDDKIKLVESITKGDV